MADLHALERELLDRPCDWLKNAVRGAAFFSAVTVPAAVSDKLNQYGVSASNASVNYSQARDAANQTVRDVASQATDNALAAVNSRYDINHSIHSLNNIGDVAGRLNAIVNPDGSINNTWLSDRLAQIHPYMQNETARLTEFAVDHARDYIMQKYVIEMLPYAVALAVIGVASLFVTVYAASYYGTRRALREFDKKR